MRHAAVPGLESGIPRLGVIHGPRLCEVDLTLHGHSHRPTRLAYTVIETGMLSPSHAVVLSQDPMSRGASVTRLVHILAGGIFAGRLAPAGVLPEDVMWVEHCPPARFSTGARRPRTLDVVSLEARPAPPGNPRVEVLFDNPLWRPLDAMLEGEGIAYDPLYQCVLRVVSSVERLLKRAHAPG